MPIQDTGEGIPTIAGTRISVKHVADRILHGDCSVEEVSTEVYPHLKETQVWEALQYVFDSPHVVGRAYQDRMQRIQRARDEAATRPQDIPDDLRG